MIVQDFAEKTRACGAEIRLTTRSKCGGAKMEVHSWRFYVDSGIVGWLIIGLLAGWLSGEFVCGKGFGCLGATVLGLIGAVLGGWLVSLLHIRAYGFLGGLAAATVGAVLLVAVARGLAGGR